MVTIKQLRWRLSKLRQRRHYLEKRCEQTSKMLSASLIFRRRTKEGTFQRAERSGIGISAYLTYHKDGATKHRYVRKGKLSEVIKLTDNYREFCKRMAQVRALNREIVTLLDRIGKIQQGGSKACQKKN